MAESQGKIGRTFNEMNEALGGIFEKVSSQ
jgi:hypothetical protein